MPIMIMVAKETKPVEDRPHYKGTIHLKFAKATASHNDYERTLTHMDIVAADACGESLLGRLKKLEIVVEAGFIIIARTWCVLDQDAAWQPDQLIYQEFAVASIS